MKWQDQHGSSTTVLLAAWSAILITIAFATEIAQQFVLREQLRTAEEAAALAGVLQTEYALEMTFRRYRNEPSLRCPEPDPAKPPPAGPPPCELVDHWVRISPARISGSEGEVWPNLWQRWAEQCNGRGYRCEAQWYAGDCWIRPKSGWQAVEAAARSAFARNAAWGEQAAVDGRVAVSLSGDTASRPERVSVQVDATLKMKTLLLSTFGIDHLTVATPGAPTTAETVRRGEKTLTTTIRGVAVPSPCNR